MIVKKHPYTLLISAQILRLMLSPAQCTQSFPFNVLNAQATAEATTPGSLPETKQDRSKMLIKGTS